MNKSVYHIRHRHKLQVTEQNSSVHSSGQTKPPTNTSVAKPLIPSRHVKTNTQTPSSQVNRVVDPTRNWSTQRRTKAKLNPSHLHTSPQAPSSDEKGIGRAKSRQESKSHPKKEPVSQCFILPKGAGARRSGSFVQQ